MLNHLVIETTFHFPARASGLPGCGAEAGGPGGARGEGCSFSLSARTQAAALGFGPARAQVNKCGQRSWESQHVPFLDKWKLYIVQY